MIYLIDDKKLRQEKDYNWSSERFAKYSKFITPIYTLEELQKNNKEVFQEGNIILYHESFIDKTQIQKEAVKRRKRLEEFSRNRSSYLVYFSGSKADRNLNENGNIASIPVSTLYKNLEVFVQKCSESVIKLEYLLFGENPEIEESLNRVLEEQWKIATTDSTIETQNQILFFQPDEKFISQPFSSYKEITLYSGISDYEFQHDILRDLNQESYNIIFIPLCFGNTLSDFNGLRLATHIRCTKTKNQTKPIFIYSPIEIVDLIGNEYFNILKTKNVFLIPFSKKAIGEAAEQKVPPFPCEELPKEVAKLKLEVPKNYMDSHSIANEWAIYRWAKTIKAEDDAIEDLIQRINSNLYFKYLQTVYPIHETQILKENDLKIKYSGNPKILYIDDEADKGWYEVFCKILYDVNKFDFDYIGNDFKNQTEDEIIERSFEKVNEFDADIVILDFRLHQNDFKKKEINEVTGIKILKRIKEYNPGIQVIVFSATSKVWNLQALQSSGTDGFIIKEFPENSVDDGFTKDSIKLFKETIEKNSKRIFLKELWIEIDKLRILASDYKNDIDIAWKLLYSSNSSEKYINYAYLQLFLIIEKFITEVSVFIKNTNGANYVIGLNGEEILVFNYLGEVNRQPNYKSAIVFENGKYGIKKDGKYNRRLDTNAIVSALLIFRFGQENSSGLNWTQVYKIRNGKAAHPEDGIVTTEELLKLINFIMFIVNEANISDTNNNSGLEKPTFEESVKLLKEKFQN